MSEHVSPSSIVVGVEGSDDSDRALQWAERWGQMIGAACRDQLHVAA